MQTATAETTAVAQAYQPAAEQPLARVQTGALTTPQALIDMAMANGAAPNVDQLERLLNLQLKWQEGERAQQRYQDDRAEEQRKREAELAFRRDFAKFRGENIVIPKTKHVQQTARNGGAGPSFWQAEFHVVMSLLSLKLAEHNFSVRHDQQFTSKPWTTEGTVSDVPWVIVTCFLEHTAGHTETLTLEGPPDTSGAKNPLQEMQSSGSFLKRQSVMAITGTAAGDEDDEGRFRGRGADGAAAADKQSGPSLADTGHDEAKKGTNALNAWWGKLTAKQRSSLNSEFGNMRKAASAADREGGAA